MSALARHIFLFILVAFSGTAVAGIGENEEVVWDALKRGRHVVLIRHAITVAGIGDPPGFVLNDCSTQRNLSEKGRQDAQRLGQAFRDRGIPVSEVLSSRWCRCMETARIAFGRVEASPMLDSMFEGTEEDNARKIREVRAVVAAAQVSGNLILVTHNRNIQALTGISPASGEMVVVTRGGGKQLEVVGRIRLPGI